MSKLISLLMLSGGMLAIATTSCSQDELAPEQNKIKDSGIPIEFRVGVSSRVSEDFDFSSVDKLGTINVTGFIGSHMIQEGETKAPEPYFENETFTQMGTNSYTSTNNYNWPGESSLEFFAYAPSLKDIREAAYTQITSTDPSAYMEYDQQIDFFNMCVPGEDGALDPITGSPTVFGTELTRGYKLGRFYVATDISKQVDFITAHAEGHAPDGTNAADANEEMGVTLNFKHQLSNIELYAFSGNTKYNIEIAGVRLGRPYTGLAIFNFCSEDGKMSAADGGKWGIAKNPQRLPVEYIFGGCVKDDGNPDEIVRLGTFQNETGSFSTINNTKAQAKNIMGNGGNAMVLPTKNGAWKGKENPWISPIYNSDKDRVPDEWSANGEYGDMYFSVLVRVTLKRAKADDPWVQIYPYRNNTKMNVIRLLLNGTKVEGRINKGEAYVGEYEVAEFGWVTVPVSVDWKRGYKYTYYLDFSKGVGIQDPDDEKPGTPIIGEGISFSVSVDKWGNGNGSDDGNSNDDDDRLEIPSK